MAENRITEPTIFTSNKLFIQQLLSYKYLYIILTFVFLCAGYVYNKTASAQYEVYAGMIATKNQTSSLLGSNQIFNGMQSVQTYNTIEDGINELRSFSMISAIIDELNLEVGYFCENTSLFKNKIELFGNTPFIVNIHKSHIQSINAKFYIDVLSDSTFRIRADQKKAMLFDYVDNVIVNKEFPVKISKEYRFNEKIDLDYLSLSITKNTEFKPIDKKKKYNYFFKLNNPDLMTKDYLKVLNVYRASSSSSILNISFRGESLDKIIIFLNKYLNFYFEENLAKKNIIARNTINFIDAQISGISDSLNISESAITSYRSENQVMNLSYQAQTAYDNLQTLERDRNNLKAQERYYTYILEYLRTTQDVAGIVQPSGMNVDNTLMNRLVVDLMNLNAERSNIISLRGEKNLFLNEVENKIKLQRQNIIEIATSSLSTVNQTLSDLDYRVAKISKEISSLPRQELNMGNIQRQFNINESIYTYLLQKRSEATITMASNYPDFALFEPARKVTSYQVTPKYLYSYIIALILGIGIPSGLMLLKNLINFKIINTEFIHQVIDRSPIATIYSISEKGDNIIFNDQASVSSESFRALRSIVFRKLSGITRSKVILITSAQPHDGKSFLSFNFATSIAMVGKKTLVIDADLKRPVLHNKFKLENKIGVSNFMAENNTIEEIINKTSVENLSFISAGPYMPNVTEVIESGGMDSLIAAVRDKFEYIIIDTSPIGFMADALLMTRYADHILLVVRNNSTLKDTFTEVIENFKSNNIANYDVVFNDKNMKDSHHGSYSNYYIKEKKSSLKDIIKQKID